MEEDIKILEEKIKALNLHILNYEKSDCKTSFYETLLLERNALGNILKERQADKEKIKNSIPKAKIEEKIDELFDEMEEYNNYDEEDIKEKRILTDMIVLLKELLKDGGE